MLNRPTLNHLLFLIPLSLGMFLIRLGVPGLMDPDEGRYAEIAREMWLLRDWLVPHLNLLPYLEKPPLVYWLTALSVGGWGEHAWAARLPAALSAVAGVFWAYGLGRALFGPGPAFLSALILTTCGGYVVLGRLLTLDMSLTLLVNLGVGLGFLAMSRSRPGLIPWAYLCLALAVLAKGPVALVLAGLIWGVWGLLRGWSVLRPLWHPLGLALLISLTLPWFLWIAWRFPEFPRFFLLEQHFGRYLTEAIHHHQSFFFYLPVLFGFMLPWSWLLPWAFGRLRFHEASGVGDSRLFLTIWAGVVVLFFSLSRGKLAPYILPAVFPLALLLGERLHSFWPGRGRLRETRGLLVSLVGWSLTGWVLVALYFWPPAVVQELLVKAAVLSPYLAAGLVILALTPTAVLICPRLEILLAGALLLSALIPGGMERVSQQRSPRELALILKSHWQPGAALIGVKLYSQAVSFYSGQIFHLLAFPTELDFGRRLVPESGLFFDQPSQMADFAQARPLVFFFLKEKSLSQLHQWVPGEIRPLARYKDCLLVSYRGK